MVEVNVAAGSKVTFNLSYQELLLRKLGIYQHKIYIDPGQPIEDLQVNYDYYWDIHNFKVNANLAVFSNVTFNLTYQEMLQRKRGIYKHKIYVNSGQAVEDLMVNLIHYKVLTILNLRYLKLQSQGLSSWL